MITQERQYLTASDVTSLLRIDKSTVYRMAEDGRLPGVKVGRQWRFLAEEVQRTFGLETAATTLDTTAAMTSLFADLYGVMAVVTDLDGRPLTAVMNPSEYFTLLGEDPAVLNTCITEWQSHAIDPGFEPILRPRHLGFLCARAYVRRGFELVGMVIAGGIAPAEWPPQPERFDELAALSGADASELATAAATVPSLDEQATEAMLASLRVLAKHLSPDQAKE